MIAFGFLALYTLSLTSALFFFLKSAFYWSRTEMRVYALWSACLQFFLSVLLAAYVHLNPMGDYPVIELFSRDGVSLAVFADFLTIWLLLLTAFLTFLCVLISWVGAIQRVGMFYGIIFLIQFCLFVVFSVTNLLLFYVFFEFLVFPMFALIGIWGSRSRKIGAAYYLFFYTLASSVLMLSAIALVYASVGGTDYFDLFLFSWKASYNVNSFVFWAMFLSFAAKLPLVPVHLWLPEAHVEAPTVGSVILAGILLKIGGYGMVRFLLFPFNQHAIDNLNLILLVGVVTAIYSFSVALVQVDLKKIVAYSSIGHMAFVLVGVFSMVPEGVEGGALMMLTHGFVSGGLFTVVGFLYDRYKTRNIAAYGGLAQVMPSFAIFTFLLILGNVAFPGTGAFAAELLVIVGLAKLNSFALFWFLLSTVIGVSYNFLFYIRIFFGPSDDNALLAFSDLNDREMLVLTLFLAPLVLAGFFPEFFLGDLHYIGISA